MDGFSFDGGTTTARALHKTITAYSEGALQTALESGCGDVPAVMAFLTQRDAQRARGAVKSGRRSAQITSARLGHRATVPG